MGFYIFFLKDIDGIEIGGFFYKYNVFLKLQVLRFLLLQCNFFESHSFKIS